MAIPTTTRHEPLQPQSQPQPPLTRNAALSIAGHALRIGGGLGDICKGKHTQHPVLLRVAHVHLPVRWRHGYLVPVGHLGCAVREIERKIKRSNWCRCCCRWWRRGVLKVKCHNNNNSYNKQPHPHFYKLLKASESLTTTIKSVG